MDTYGSFFTLMEAESDFHIEWSDRGSNITILAPHGGNIEPHTSEISRLIAGDQYNYFCFNGLKVKDNSDLHIASHFYDEEHALNLVEKSAAVVAIHGCTQREPLVYLGGLDTTLIKNMRSALEFMAIQAPPSPVRFAGINKNNICNRGITGKGVQLEISRPLRDSRDAWALIADAVRSVLSAQALPAQADHGTN